MSIFSSFKRVYWPLVTHSLRHTKQFDWTFDRQCSKQKGKIDLILTPSLFWEHSQLMSDEPMVSVLEIGTISYCYQHVSISVALELNQSLTTSFLSQFKDAGFSSKCGEYISWGTDKSSLIYFWCARVPAMGKQRHIPIKITV